MGKTIAKRAFGVVTVLVTLLALSEAPAQLRKWRDAALTLLGVGGWKVILLAAALGVFLWAWDVPQRLMARRQPDFKEKADRERIRVHAARFFRALWSDTARHAFGHACEEAGAVANVLRAEKRDAVRTLAANLLVEAELWARQVIDVMLKDNACNDDAQLARYVDAWGELFVRYQRLVTHTHHGHRALDVSPWTRGDYARWRDYDGTFIKQMRIAEYMDGAVRLRHVSDRLVGARKTVRGYAVFVSSLYWSVGAR